MERSRCKNSVRGLQKAKQRGAKFAVLKPADGGSGKLYQFYYNLGFRCVGSRPTDKEILFFPPIFHVLFKKKCCYHHCYFSIFILKVKKTRKFCKDHEDDEKLNDSKQYEADRELQLALPAQISCQRSLKREGEPFCEIDTVKNTSRIHPLAMLSMT
jgi:hypothetical protein